MRRSRLRFSLILIAVLLLGTALRFYRLDAQSFWNDEGNTARLIERPIRLIVEGAAGDIHPPGYYLLMAAWRVGVGHSEFALRAFSAFAGVLMIAVAAALGNLAGKRPVATGAAFLTAIHPLAVYYSQEARMYALLGLLSVLTLLTTARLARRLLALPAARASFGGALWRDAAIAVLCIATGLYTQYFFGLVVLVINLVFLASWLAASPRVWRVWIPWLTAQVAGGLLFLPWLPNVFRAASWRPPDLNTGEALRDLSRGLLVGITSSAPPGYGVWAAVLLLLILGFRTRPRLRFAKWLCTGAAILPALALLALNVYRPAYLKFLLASVAPLAVTLALPLGGKSPPARHTFRSWLVRGLGFLAILALLPVQAHALRNLYFDPAFARSDYRGIAAQIASEADPQTAVILSAPNQWEVFTYYFAGDNVFPAPYHPTEERAVAWFDEVLALELAQLYAVFWGDGESDPHRRIEFQLAQRAYPARDLWVGDVRVVSYGMAALPAMPEHTVAAVWDSQFMLDGYAIGGQRFAPGTIVPVSLFWRAGVAGDARCKVFVHLLDATGALVAQHDAEPVAGFRPTTTWQSGETVVDRHGVLIPETLPGGEYTLSIGMYLFSGERLPVVVQEMPVGDVVPLAVLTITR